MSPKTLDPTLPWCIQHRHLFHPLEDLQNAVISDIQNLVFEMEEHTMGLVSHTSGHVQRAYDTKTPLHRSQCSYTSYARYNIHRRSLSTVNSPKVSLLWAN